MGVGGVAAAAVGGGLRRRIGGDADRAYSAQRFVSVCDVRAFFCNPGSYVAMQCHRAGDGEL